MKLPCTLSFEDAKIVTPLFWFAEIRFPAPGLSPPMRLNSPLSISTPDWPFGTAAVPFTSVPIRLPCTVITLASNRAMPKPLLPEMTLPASRVVPPMKALAGLPGPTFSMPTPFGSAVVPSAVVPIKLPWMYVPESKPNFTPTWLLPEMTFPLPGCSPPIIVLSAAATKTPTSLGTAAMPVRSVPM